MGLINALSDTAHVSEDASRLVFSILAGYPIAAFYRTFLKGTAPVLQHSFIVAVGVALYWFNCGYAIYHSLASILIAYTLTNALAGTTLSVGLAHFFFLGHLMVGYWFVESHQYDITWTTPFCIMTLRFIGLVMDVYDGQKPRDKLRPDQLQTAIVVPPSLLEVAAFGFFFTGTLVGPQFSLNRFRAFINGEYLDADGNVPPSSIMASIRRFVAGVFFAVIHAWGVLWVSDAYIISPEFNALPFYWKLVWNVVWFRAIMYRYCAVWLLTEGAAILSGLAYNGKDEDGEERWDGVRDIHIVKFELGSDFQSVIESFNCGTNTFAKNHIFRRLKWLGHKYYSHTITLLYLAVWHGYHLGYFLLFAVEFACVLAQDQLYSLIRRTQNGEELFSRWWVRPFTWLFGRIAINVSMAFAFLTFGLVKKEVWIGPLGSMYYWGYAFYFLAWPLAYQVLKRVLPRKKLGAKEMTKEKSVVGLVDGLTKEKSGLGVVDVGGMAELKED